MSFEMTEFKFPFPNGMKQQATLDRDDQKDQNEPSCGRGSRYLVRKQVDFGGSRFTTLVLSQRMRRLRTST